MRNYVGSLLAICLAAQCSMAEPLRSNRRILPSTARTLTPTSSTKSRDLGFTQATGIVPGANSATAGVLPGSAQHTLVLPAPAVCPATNPNCMALPNPLTVAPSNGAAGPNMLQSMLPALMGAMSGLMGGGSGSAQNKNSSTPGGSAGGGAGGRAPRNSGNPNYAGNDGGGNDGSIPPGGNHNRKLQDGSSPQSGGVPENPPTATAAKNCKADAVDFQPYFSGEMSAQRGSTEKDRNKFGMTTLKHTGEPIEIRAGAPGLIDEITKVASKDDPTSSLCRVVVRHENCPVGDITSTGMCWTTIEFKVPNSADASSNTCNLSKKGNPVTPCEPIAKVGAKTGTDSVTMGLSSEKKDYLALRLPKAKQEVATALPPAADANCGYISPGIRNPNCSAPAAAAVK